MIFLAKVPKRNQWKNGGFLLFTPFFYVLLSVTLVVGVWMLLVYYGLCSTTWTAFAGESSPQTPEEFCLHYVRFRPDDGNLTFRFSDFLSVLSAVQRMEPDCIVLHGDYEPVGNHWQILKSAGFIQHRFRNATPTAGYHQGLPQLLGWKEHWADHAKLDILLEHGGVAVDFDVFFVQGHRIRDILKRKSTIVCYGDSDGYNIGFVAALKGSYFIWAWLRSYQDIYVRDWNFNQAYVAKYLSILFPNEVYVINGVCNNPHPYNLDLFFRGYGQMNWKDSVAIHTYERFGGVPINGPDDLFRGNLTSHKELFISVYKNKNVTVNDVHFRDEIDPLLDKLVVDVV